MRVLVLPVVLLALVGPARAADHPVRGTLLRLRGGGKAGRSVTVRTARDPVIVASPATDPRTTGGVLSIMGLGEGDGDTGSIALAATRWRGLGKPAGSRGYRYFDPRARTGVREVVLRTTPAGGVLTIRGGGRAWSYRIRNAQGPILVRIALGRELYCAEFRTFRRNRPPEVLARHAPAPPDCGGGTPPPGCGNGVAEAGEACDDGDTTSLDGCSASCRLESTAALCAGVAPVAGAALRAVRIVSGLTDPTFLGAPPLDPTRLFVVEQPGRIRVVKDGRLLSEPFLDITDRVLAGGERGLFSVAFHPRYDRNGRFFVYYTDRDGSLVIARYETDPSADTADPATEKVVLSIPHPGAANHNGGQLQFGPDGFL